jgi:hypothetical protein
MSNLVKTNMLLAASMVLYKFTEGEEDWTEWDDLAQALEDDVITARNRVSTTDKTVVMRRVNEFRNRQAAALESRTRAEEHDTADDNNI